MQIRFANLLFYAVMAATVEGCMMGPDYVKPKVQVPVAFKELQGWQQAQPKDDRLPGKWWEMFGDPQLNALEEQVVDNNQTLAAAEAQYRQAQHLVQTALAAYLPTGGVAATVNRFRAATGQNVAVSGVRYLFGTALNISWEPDLWGSVRRQVEANVGSAQASAATLQALCLSTQATLAQDYFQLRALDAQRQLLNQTVAAYRKTLEITRNRYAVGVAALSDVVQAEAQLESARAQAVDVEVMRSQMEHALAVLVGKSPAELDIGQGALTTRLPTIPVAVPSAVLERRPDIASAERSMAATNAKIGVAKAAYFPTLTLSATNGFQTANLSKLFSMATRYWALGPAAAAWTLLDGGAHSAQLKQAIDAFDASVAQYRQSVLTGFQEVEDSLSALRTLEEESHVQDKAVRAAESALTITENQYKAGTVGYSNVMIAQAAALNNRKSAVTVFGQRLIYAVQLVKALGGGWGSADLPDADSAAGERKWTDFLPFPLQ
ncbi:efflux transporter outer membrane subunit [Methylomicrobium agile]|uniref:efflux transporter outer membrane subunit n=1 Tax=Methylomicrobium agile TaxID=39774 RepID=UPI0004DFCD1D|nr:efflux transporter outer membrane subunit [Methylomicrobium agile]